MSKKTATALRDRLHLSFRVQVPQILQTEVAECGLACLVMICRYYRKDIDLLSLRQHYDVSVQGMNLARLIEIAKQLNLNSRPLSLDLAELNQLKTPCILHWDLNHFVVLVAVKNNKAIVHDPAFGRKELRLTELSQHFTGVALELWPTLDFDVKAQRQKISFRALLKNIDGLATILSKIFIFSLLLEAINLLLPIGTQLVMDHVILAKDNDLLTLICLGLFIFIIIRTVTAMFRAWITVLMDSLMNIQWQQSFFEHLLKLPLQYFEKRNPGDIQSRFMSLQQVRQTLSTGLTGSLIDGMMLIALMVMMYLYGGWLLGVVLAFTAVYVLLRMLTFRLYKQAAEEQIIKQARANSNFMESMYAISTVKVLGLADMRTRFWMNLNIDSINAGIRVTRLDMLYGGMNSLIAALDQILILWLGAVLVMQQQLSLGMFVAFNLYRAQFSDRAASLIDLLLQFKMLSLHNERLADIALSHVEPQQQSRQVHARAQGAASLVVQNLSYSYDRLSSPIFEQLNFSVEAGESVAITGVSGVGKSTLLKLMTGLLLPTQGRILFNCYDIYQMGLSQYRQCIACVLQDDKLFAGSIADNICAFDLHPDMEHIIACAKACNIFDEIMQMPMGLQTLISELGSSLSGGQIQRLFIARALYRKPSILFMDEATSHLDVENEAWINQQIRALSITRIFIAHRQSTIASADRVLTLLM